MIDLRDKRRAARRGNALIAISFLVAFLLTALPLPTWMVPWRPLWVLTVLIYWCIALPERVGVFVALALGLLLDVYEGTLLGRNSLGLIVVTYIAHRHHLKLRVCPFVQQSLFVFSLALLYLLILLLVEWLLGIPPVTARYWLPAVSSMLLWPWLFVILRDARRRFFPSRYA